MTLQGVRHLPLSKGIDTCCQASMTVGSAGFTCSWCVWHGIIQVFNTCVMISGTLLLFSSDVSGQFCMERRFEENCLGEECYDPSTSCWVFAPQHCSPALNKPLLSTTPDFGKVCLYCHNSGGWLISTNTHTHKLKLNSVFLERNG